MLSHSPIFCRIFRFSIACLSACALLSTASYARALEETPARIEALEQYGTLDREEISSRSFAADDTASTVETEEAIQEPVPSRLLGKDSREALIADSAFLSARTAFRKNHPEALDELREQTRGHPLASYVDFWRLLLKLQSNTKDSVAIEEMSRFASGHKEDYLGERAQGELARIAAYSGDTQSFEKRWKQLSWQKSEADLHCLRILMNLRAKHTKETLAAAKKELVLARATQNKAYGLLATETLAASPKWTWNYLLVLLQKNQRSLAKELLDSPEAKNLPVKASLVKNVIQQPQRWYKNNAKKLSRTPARVLAIAAITLARKDTDGAARIAQAAIKRLDSATRAIMWGYIAYQSALNHNPKAPNYYQQAGSSLATNATLVNREAVLTWQVRANLRMLNWQKVLQSIQRLPSSIANQPTWVYWKARALASTGKKTAAKKLYQKISNDTSFYGLLARDALKLPYEAGMTSLTPPLTAEKKATFDANPHLQRAMRFYDLDLFYEGNREWSWAMRNMKARERLELAEYALQIGLTHRAINTSASTGLLVRSQSYPRAHEKAVTDAAHVVGLPEDWLFGLIRQESRFIARAKSSVGALGLMQVMPRTARWVAKKIALNNYREGELTKLDTNLLIGAQYLKLVSDNFEGSIPLSCAAYNAGPSRAQLWQSRLVRPVDGAIFAETIPFTETRGYVKHVAANTAQYMFGKPEQKQLTEILGEISPKENRPATLP